MYYNFILKLSIESLEYIGFANLQQMMLLIVSKYIVLFHYTVDCRKIQFWDFWLFVTVATHILLMRKNRVLSINSENYPKFICIQLFCCQKYLQCNKLSCIFNGFWTASQVLFQTHFWMIKCRIQSCTLNNVKSDILINAEKCYYCNRLVCITQICYLQVCMKKLKVNVLILCYFISFIWNIYSEMQ